jgi:hypothetical protein
LNILLKLKLVLVENFVVGDAVVQFLQHRVQGFVEINLLDATFKLFHFGMRLSQLGILLHQFAKLVDLLSIFIFQPDKVDRRSFQNALYTSLSYV